MSSDSLPEQPRAFDGGSSGVETVMVAFDDNRLLPQLFGQHDQHLALIEDRLGVEATPRGNHLALTGSPDACRNAQRVLDELYERLKQGLEIGPGEVDGAIRMNTLVYRGGDNDAGGDVTIRTRRRVISPRSPAQKAYIQALQSHELTFGIGPAGHRQDLSCGRGGGDRPSGR